MDEFTQALLSQKVKRVSESLRNQDFSLKELVMVCCMAAATDMRSKRQRGELTDQEAEALLQEAFAGMRETVFED
ncbi:hypothetical protein C84B14_08767 [Salinisphaera sp. C84B14]|uniref:hypothetical protein n=1 Tax=Salinisphaera sp. C84B14 TaxID=1304155 RepID=UPI00333F032B